MTAPSTSSHVDEHMPWKLDRGRSLGEMGYLPGLDGLRAVAIIGVLLYHAGIDWMPGGFLGVDVFFVISGFLITSLILAEYDRSGRVNFTKFYLGRARRLLPALLHDALVRLGAGRLLPRRLLAVHPGHPRPLARVLGPRVSLPVLRVGKSAGAAVVLSRRRLVDADGVVHSIGGPRREEGSRERAV